MYTTGKEWSSDLLYPVIGSMGLQQAQEGSIIVWENSTKRKRDITIVGNLLMLYNFGKLLF